jgi:hypothetical protein
LNGGGGALAPGLIVGRPSSETTRSETGSAGGGAVAGKSVGVKSRKVVFILAGVKPLSSSPGKSSMTGRSGRCNIQVTTAFRDQSLSRTVRCRPLVASVTLTFGSAPARCKSLKDNLAASASLKPA